MKRILLAIVSAFLMSAPMAFAQTTNVEQTKDLDAKYATNMLKPGTRAPEFKLKTYDAKDIMLSQYRGSYVVLDFWASWCPDCRRDIPAMKALYEQFRDYGVQFIGISFDTDREVWAQTYWGKYQMHWTQVSELKKFRKNTVIDKLYKITFEGGQEAINNYFAQSQRRSIQSLRSKVHAEMTVVFNVEMDGTVTGARVVEVKNVKGTSKHFMKMEAEKQKRVLDNCVEYYKEQAVRLTNNMPKWNPAMQNGRPVKSKTTVNIVFQS